MALPDLSNVFPPLYARWMAELLQGPLPSESRCTCDNCAVSVKPGLKKIWKEGKDKPPVFEDRPFDPHLKCCTVTPKLANFLVGSALADPNLSPVGRESLEKRIATRKAVTPFGLWQVEAGNLDYRRRIAAGFGCEPDLLCPHYNVAADNCGIWKHRNGVCSSYFCRPMRGYLGATFWIGGFRPLSRTLEPALAQWAARQAGLPESCIPALYDFRRHPETAPWSDLCDDEGTPDAEAYAAGWGPWAGREAQFYQACAEKVRALSWAQVEEICGESVKALAAVTVAAYRAMQPKETPKRLKLNWGNFYWVAGQDGAPDRYLTYDLSDFVELPRALGNVLIMFKDGADTAEVLERAAAQGAAVPAETLEDLITHEVLVAC
jgi:hypothetical protein